MDELYYNKNRESNSIKLNVPVYRDYKLDKSKIQSVDDLADFLESWIGIISLADNGILPKNIGKDFMEKFFIEVDKNL